MNHTVSQRAEIVMRAAHIVSLVDSLRGLRDYANSPKFSAGPCPCPAGPSCPHIHATDVIAAVDAAIAAGYEAGEVAYANEVGPKPEPGPNGWQCPVCHDPLVTETPWNDSEAKIAARMLAHWTTAHKAVYDEKTGRLDSQAWVPLSDHRYAEFDRYNTGECRWHYAIAGADEWGRTYRVCNLMKDRHAA